MWGLQPEDLERCSPVNLEPVVEGVSSIRSASSDPPDAQVTLEHSPFNIAEGGRLEQIAHIVWGMSTYSLLANLLLGTEVFNSCIKSNQRTTAKALG